MSHLSLALKWIAVVSSALLTLSAAAQTARAACEDAESAKGETIAELRDLQGNVLVSDPAGIASGVDKQRLKNKVRVTTTSRAGVVISFDCGCDVRLKENERFEVDAPRACPAMLAAVQAVPVGAPIGAVAATTPVVTGGITTGQVLGVTGAGVGAYLLYRNNRNVSPN